MTILCYHAVQSHWTSPLTIEPSMFERQCAWLAKRRTVLPLDVAVTRLDSSWRLPAGQAAITFDDGFASVREHALPTLVQHRLPATVFLVTDTLSDHGQPVDWVDTPPPYPLQTLTVEEVFEMRDAGVAFASHSSKHLDLTTLDYDTCVADLRRSREFLEDLLGHRVPFLAYPRGRNNASVRRAAAEAGYSHSFTLPEGPEPQGPHGVPRVGVFSGNGMTALRVKAQRAYLPLRTGRPYNATQGQVRAVVSRRRSTRGSTR